MTRRGSYFAAGSRILRGAPPVRSGPAPFVTSSAAGAQRWQCRVEALALSPSAAAGGSSKSAAMA